MGRATVVRQRRCERLGMLDTLRLCEPHLDSGGLDQLVPHQYPELGLCSAGFRGIGPFPSAESVAARERDGYEDKSSSADCCGCAACGLDDCN